MFNTAGFRPTSRPRVGRRKTAGTVARAALAASLLAMSTVALSGTAQAAWPGGDGRIAFDSDVSGTSLQIYSMREDGSHRRQLTTEGNNGDPSWSPDGRRLAFDSDRAGGSHIFVMDATGGRVRDVNPDGNCTAYPSWMPGGREIIFSHYPDPACIGAPDIWIESSDGTHARPLTNTPDDRELKPEASPDGSRIAFMSHTSAPGTFAVSTVRPDGADRRQITPLSLDATYPDWSPDSRWLVIASNADRSLSAIYVVRRNGTGLRQLTEPTSGDNSKPRFAPDGRSIIFSSNSATPDQFELFTLDLRSHQVRQLTNTPEGSEYFSSWQPHGDRDQTN